MYLSSSRDRIRRYLFRTLWVSSPRVIARLRASKATTFDPGTGQRFRETANGPRNQSESFFRGGRFYRRVLGRRKLS